MQPDSPAVSPPESTGEEEIQELVQAFFASQEDMARSISVLCGSNHKQQSNDTITPVILMMLNSQVQVQLTVVGWQPFRTRDLTYPYQQMNARQKQAILALLDQERHGQRWTVFEHAMTFRRGIQSIQLMPLDVLSALCSLVLSSELYPDKRLRLAICNILLQRVQANVVLDKHTQAALNARLFPPPSPTPPTKMDHPGDGAISPGGSPACIPAPS
jgi:hypothetical protein